MDNSTARSKRVSRGWWRVFAGVLFVVATTLGVAFYLPLRQSHRLLTAELASARSNNEQLGRSLEQSSAKLEQMTAERDELAAFKADVDSKQRQYPELVQQFERVSDPRIRTALDKKQIFTRTMSNGVSIGWSSPALLNWKRSGPTITGQRLLCPVVAEAAGLGLPDVTVRTFLAPDAVQSDVHEALTTATELANSLGDQLVRSCKLAPRALSVASSLGTKGSPLVQFEFRNTAAQATPTPASTVANR